MANNFNFQQQQRMSMMPQQQQRPMINDQFLMNSMQGGMQNMMNGGMPGMRSQTDLRQQQRMTQQRSPTPDMGQFQQMMGNNSSAQSGKNFMNPMQQTGYTQPFAMYPNEPARPQSHHSGSDMQFSGSHNFEQPMMNQLGNHMQGQFVQNQMMMQGDQLNNSGMYASGQNFGGFNNMNNQQQQQMQAQNQFLPPPAQGGGDQNLNYEQILSKMAGTIEEFDRNGNRFFSEFDAYFDRKFQVWELASMFEIPIQQARKIAKEIDRSFEACVPLKRLCDELQNYMKAGKIDSLGFNASSEYGQRFKSSPQQSSFRKLAKFLKESADFAPNSHSYYEVFQSIIKKTNGQGNNWVKKFSLKDILNQKCAKILNTSEVEEFVNFIQITNQRNEISVVQFVGALRSIEIDYKVWDLNELLVYIKNLSTQTVQLDSLIERLRDYIFSRALNFEETFSKKSTLKIKTKEGNEECECVKVSELNKFLDREQALGFSVKEKEKIIKTYQVELMFDPGASKLREGLNNSKGSSSLAGTVAKEGVMAMLERSQSPAPSAITPPPTSITPPPQNMAATDSQSQLPNLQLHEQSSDSINRGELSNSQSGNLPKMPPPTSLVPEKVNEEDYEEWDDDERIEEDIDLKEGGQREVGARYLNYQKLMKDLKPTQEMLDSSLTQARRLKFEILESIKGWIVLTGESILNSFKGGDRKGTLLATKRQIKQFLQKVLNPKPASDALADAMTTFFMQVNEQGLTCIDYKQFYNFFYHYANLNQMMPADPNYKVLDPFRNLPKVKSLASLMQITNTNTRFKHEPIEVDNALFFQMMDREKAKVQTRTQQREQKTTQNTDLLMKIMGGSSKPNQVSLVKYQELIGFPREEEPLFIQGVSFRQVCIKLQMSQTSIKKCQTTIGKTKSLPKFLGLMNQLLMLDMNDFQDQQLFQVLYTMVLEYSTGQSINTSKFLGRLEFENNKLWQLQRFYLELKIKSRKQKVELADILLEYGADMSLKEMTREQFETMLTDLSLIAAFDKQDLKLQEIRSQELSYFTDEYDQDDSRIVNVKRLEEDFDEFVGSANTDSVLDRISDHIMKCIATYCIQVHQEDIYKTIKEAQAVNKRHQQNNDDQEWIHSYDFVTWFHDTVMIRFFQQNYDTELIQLFTQFIGIEIGRKNVLNIPLFIKKIVEVQPQLKSKSLDLQIVKNQARKLKIRIVEVLEYMQRAPVDYFRGVQATDYEFEQMLSAKEFQIQSMQLTSTLQEIIEFFKGQDNYVQVTKFCEELNELLRVRELKMNHFKSMHRQLKQKGTSIQEAIDMVKGKILIAASSGFLMEDFISLCKGYDLKADVEGVLKPIMSTFEPNEFGEVPISDFIDDFNQIFTRKQPAFMQQSVLGQAGDQIVKGPQVVATRYFDSVEHLMDQIANDIMDRNLADFGSYLKGNDYKDQGLIANSDFFQVIEKLFPQCGKGDILDLIECFDPQSTGVINIVTVADALNRRLRSCFVMLRSHVSQVVDEAIVEPITPRKATLKQSRPENFNTVFLDLLAGLLCRKQGLMSDWFNMFGRQQEGYMSFIEFRAALDKTDVQGPQETKFQLFEYLKSHQEHEFSHSLVMISQLFIEISKDFPRQDLDTVINEVLRKVAVHLQNSQIPVRDSCKKYETHEGSGEILYSDFTFALLADEWKLKSILTRNMLDLLQFKYNPTQAQNVPFEPLILSLQVIEQEQNLNLAMTQQEIDEAHAKETGITYVKSHVAPKTEPVYEERSKKNTYFDQIAFGVNLLSDPFHIKCCDDILLETRQRGLSVEQHFQKYGVFSKQDGERHIDIGEFREALMNLSFQWASNSEAVKSFYKAIEQVFDHFQGLTLEMIGGSVFMNSNVNLLEEENQVLDLVYKQIKDQGLITSITDLINFINFERDGTTTLHEFEKLLIDTFKIKDKIPRNRVNLLCQRYRVRGRPNKKQIVMHYLFMQDLAYKHIGIGLINQWAARVSENIVKQIQTKIMLDTSGQGMTDDEVETEIKNFFVRSSMQGGQLQFSYTDCTRAFKSLHLIKDQVDDSHKVMDDFFKFCSQLNPSLSTIAPIDITNVDLPAQIEFNQVVQTVLRLAKKPVTGLYSDVMDLVYLSSKKRHVSISGPYLIHLFKEDDRANSGVIPFDLFITRVQEKILGSPGDVSKADTTFLATKYLSQFTLQSGQYTKQVSYNLFMNDYYYYETGHIGECINLLLAAGNKQRQQELLQNMQSPKDKVKGIEDLPKEQQAIFVKMGKYLMSKDLDEFLCGELVNRDQARCGFLTKDDIKAAVKRVGIPISEKQVTELTQVVSVDSKNRYNYLELIAYLLGVRYMQRLQTENNIWPDRDQIQVPKVDLQTLHLTQSLIDQLELKLANLRYLANEMQKGSQFLRVDQLFILFRLSQIAVSSKDHDTLQTYLNQTKDASGQININHLLSHFKVNESPSALLTDIQRQLRGKDLKTIFTSAQELTFGDFKNCLMKQNVNLPKTNEMLQKLFNLISDQKDEVSRHTLERIIEFEPNPSTTAKGTNKDAKTDKKLPTPPPAFINLVKFLIKNDCNMMLEFADCVQGKRIPEQRFSQYLNKIQFQFKTITEKSQMLAFFQEKDGQLNFPKLVTYIRLDHPTYGKQITQIVNPQISKTQLLTKAKQTIATLPHDIKSILHKLCSQVRSSGLKPDQLMKELDLNKDGCVKLDEFDSYCLTNQLSNGLSKESVTRLFKYIDANNDGHLSIQELSSLIDQTNLVFEDLMSQFSQSFEQELVVEIRELFDKMDSDKNKFLTADELMIVMKQTRGHQITVEQARDIIDQITQDTHGKITKDQFVKYLLPRQKQQLLTMDDAMEDLRELFGKYSSAKGGFGGELLLNKQQLKTLIVEAGYSKVKDQEVDQLFIEIDSNSSGFIDKDEFMAYMYVGDKVQLKSRDTLLRIRKAHMKLNTGSVFDMVRLIPKFTTLSFTQSKLEQEKTNRPSQSLMPVYDYKVMKYRALAKVKDFKSAPVKEFISRNKPDFSIECSIVDICGVPNLSSEAVGMVSHLEVRYFLFDQDRKVAQSSIQISSAKLVPLKDRSKPAISQGWSVPDTLKSLIVRGNDQWSLVIELVSIDEKDQSKQITVGWTSVPIKQTKLVKLKLPLNGGSPFNSAHQEIITQENEIKPKSGFFKQLQSAKVPVVERYIMLEVKPFDKIEETIQAQICILPENQICWKSIMAFAQAFRCYSYSQLIKDEITMQNPKSDLILSQFSKIYDCPDVQKTLCEFWTQICPLKTPLDAQIQIMTRTVTRIYGLQYDPIMKMDSVYPTRTSVGALAIKRHEELQKCILQENPKLMDKLAKAVTQKVHTGILFMEEYTPFTATELDDVGNKVGLDKENERRQDELESMFIKMGLKL